MRKFIERSCKAGGIGWKPTMKLIEGIGKTYPWIKEQVEKSRKVRS